MCSASIEMRFDMNLFDGTLVKAIFIVATGTVAVSHVDMQEWLIKMHRTQIELLKIDWGNPGFCTEWDRNNSAETKSCDGLPLMVRKFY